jgi:uncharacterized membrane protein YkvA (DUF1232 family)
VGTFLKKVKQESAYLSALAAHPQTPSVARWLLIGALAYLLSPFDLIPDWIPVLGQLDDLLIVPVLIYSALVIIPLPVKKECRDRIVCNQAWIKQNICFQDMHFLGKEKK